jgi:Tfp pilus assembly protein PilV
MNRECKRAGFTLVEALVAVVLVAVGIVASLGAMGALSAAQSRSFERERIERLAVQKYDELVATGDYVAAGLSGDFTEWNQPGYVWDATVVPTGFENLEALEVTVRRATDEGPIGRASGLVFQPPVVGIGEGGGL